MPQTAAATNAARVSPRLSKRCVTSPPPHWNCSQAAKNREKPAQPMSTVKKRRLRAILLSLTGTPAPKRHKSGLRRYLSLLGPYTLPPLAGEGRVVGYLPASPTVTGNSLTSPARTTLTVWVAPTLILRSPEYRSSRL